MELTNVATQLANTLNLMTHATVFAAIGTAIAICAAALRK